ncbi:uncharacterized protein I206_107225 [Kwoniella pini CBS 10737]|uniref:RNase III domain-containing protein n=1 Tax=Kwoniella pini CBS 10737 TaxID=1296096 RepID=A0A1B9HYU7_9TREE|nr:uncharacterized protein I206_05231 [Kwoniella pini CBS 10737]OCF48452.1 hypothetical protein I206_05231 [Kwoniella pini CBS 10737]
MSEQIPTSALVLLESNFVYPPLPPITDPKLKKAVFTHRSLVNSLPSDLQIDWESYDKSAHVGDSLLDTFITCLLHAMYPTARPKVATDLRSKLVNREINSHISRYYDLPSKVKTSKGTSGTFQLSNDEVGEVYEAYLAGLFYSYLNLKSLTSNDEIDFIGYGKAFEKLSNFLILIYKPLIKSLYDDRINKFDYLIEISEGSKSELNTFTQKFKISQPQYGNPELIWPYWIPENERKGNYGKVWQNTCTVFKKDGTMITCTGMAEGTRVTAENVAAYLVLQQLKGQGRNTY